MSNILFGAKNGPTRFTRWTAVCTQIKDLNKQGALIQAFEGPNYHKFLVLSFSPTSCFLIKLVYIYRVFRFCHGTVRVLHPRVALREEGNFYLSSFF
jgi:hypothetical protein